MGNRKMMYKKIIAVLFIIMAFEGMAQDTSLFKIVQDNRIGYIDVYGNAVIKPAFLNGNDFSEGLAAVRVNGLYGFIDPAGKFVIHPQYDYALNFQHGIACVYKEGKPFFINRKEDIVLDTVYKAVQFITNDLAVVETAKKVKGIISLGTKKLLADTIFQKIGLVRDGVAVVVKKKKNAKSQELYAVIDASGNMVVPFGVYREINDYVNGYALAVEDNEHGDDKDVVIDTKGFVVFERYRKNNSYLSESFYDGLAVVDLYKYWLKEDKGVSYTSSKRYEGYINLKGEVVFEDSTARSMKRFSGGRAFAETNGKYRMINTRFQQVGHEIFDKVLNDGFKNNYAIVGKQGQWGIVDTNGSIIIEPKYDLIDETGLADSFFFFGVESYDDEEGDLFGIAALNGKKILNPIMQQFDRTGFHNGLLKAIINSRLTYIDKAGNIVWQEKITPATALEALNIDFMNRGYFYAQSKPHEDDLGGFGRNENAPKPLVAAAGFPADKLSVVVKPGELDTIQDHYKGCVVYVANSTNREIEFNAQDSRLYMNVQAKDAEGRWRDIEYLPVSWCGNSYHIMTLSPNSFWSFSTPLYEGGFPTKLRIELKYIDPKRKENDGKRRKVITVYSNEYDGSINLAQFWNKRTYYPGGIMDPYYD